MPIRNLVLRLQLEKVELQAAQSGWYAEHAGLQATGTHAVSDEGGPMHTIDLAFASFNEVSLDHVIARYGVYVLWGTKATRCPTYIGEGKLLGRLAPHIRKFGDGVAGYFAAIDGPTGASKHDGHVAEAMLIRTAVEIGRPPRHNRNAGCVERVRSLGERHGVLKVVVHERDPFQPPDAAVSKLSAPRVIRVDFKAMVRKNADVGDWLEQPWRRSA